MGKKGKSRDGLQLALFFDRCQYPFTYENASQDGPHYLMRSRVCPLCGTKKACINPQLVSDVFYSTFIRNEYNLYSKGFLNQDADILPTCYLTSRHLSGALSVILMLFFHLFCVTFPPSRPKQARRSIKYIRVWIAVVIGWKGGFLAPSITQFEQYIRA